MPSADRPDLTLFLDIIHTLERIGAPYMIIGGFAATMYGITRTTFDIGGSALVVAASHLAIRSLTGA